MLMFVFSSRWCRDSVQSSQYKIKMAEGRAPPSRFLYLLREALQALISAAHHHILPDPHQTDRVGGQLDAVLRPVRLPKAA